MSIKNITFILGTAREGRRSQNVARFVFECAQERDDLNASFIDVRDHAQDKTRDTEKPGARPWQEIAKASDGFVIISPEYNHGYPGELKMLLDNAYKEYRDKPFAICGVSIGATGGARMAEQLKLVLSAFQAPIINNVLYFGQVENLFDDAGAIKNADEWKKRVNKLIDEVLKYV
jgi:NAD(P)H-dependent FMN reductase